MFSSAINRALVLLSANLPRARKNVSCDDSRPVGSGPSRASFTQ